jgi:hypothetical protein
MCIRCHGNIFTEPLSSNERGIHIQTDRRMGGIYEIRRWDGFKRLDMHTKLHNIYSSIQKLMGGYTDAQTHRQKSHFISLLLFSQNKESRLKIHMFFAFEYI